MVHGVSAGSDGRRHRSPPAAILRILLLLPGVLPWIEPAAAADATDGLPSYYAPNSDLSEPSKGDLNISPFIYRDRNRNGIFDVGDRPLASIVVEMTAPDGTKTVRRSNIHGFANFKMSRAREADITGPGAFSFRAVAPPGWDITSGNADDRSFFRALPGAPADIVAESPPGSVGLAPRLSIAGRLARRAGDTAVEGVENASLSAVSPDGRAREVEIGDGGAFRIPASEGVWRLVARPPGDGAVVRREVVVRAAPVRLSAIVFGAADRAPAARTVEIDFEGISQAALAKLPSGTAGLSWDYMNMTESHFYEGEGYVNATISGQYVGYNSSGHPVTVASEDGFDFVGAYFGVAWRSAEGERLTVRAWRDGELAGEESFPLSSLGPVWFDADYRDIDRLTIATEHYWQFVTDDMVVRTPSVNP